MSDTQPQPVGHDMTRFWRLVSVEGGPVTGTFWVRRPDRRGAIVTAVDVTVWADGARTLRPHVRGMTSFIEGDEVDISEHSIDPSARSDVLDRIDAVKAAILAAARAAEWWH